MEYRCPHCGEKIKKGANTCPECEKTIYWLPVSSEDINTKTIKSRVYIKPGSTSNMTRSSIEKQVGEQLFKQMFEVVASIWKVERFRDRDLEGYEASFNIVEGVEDKKTVTKRPIEITKSYDRPVLSSKEVIREAKPKSSTAISASKVARETVNKAELSPNNGNAYDRAISKELKQTRQKQQPKAEFLEFAQRLKDTTMPAPNINNNGDDFTMNIF